MIELEINGQPLDMFKNVSVTRSFQSVPAEFSFTATVSPSDLTKFPVTIGDACKVIVAGKVFTNGFVDEINPTHTDTAHEIRVSGASKVVDLVETCIDGSFDVQGPVTLVEALETMIARADVDVNVINETGKNPEFAQDEIVAGNIGTSLWSLMLQCAIKKNVLLTENLNGDVVITNAEGKRINTTLKKRQDDPFNNIMTSSMRQAHTQRYYRYQVVSQAGSQKLVQFYTPTNIEGAQPNDVAAEAFDQAIRVSRTKCLIAENSSDFDQCVERAVWQSNISRVQSFEYNCTVQGFFYETGELIDCGQVINVQDVYMSISSDLIIDTVTMTYSERAGSLTRLKMLLPDAFSLQANEPSFEQSGNIIGGIYDD